MTYNVLGPGALDYLPCSYGTSKLTFRGPQRDMLDPYVAFLGGTHTFGKFIRQPYPLRVEHLTGVTSVNFGQMNAGLDVFMGDPVVPTAARGARVVVLEVLGAGNLTNRLYRVHKRRNDRFLYAQADLKRLFPEVDFAQFNFTRHMLLELYQRDPQRFAVVRRGVQRVWMRRTRQLVGQLGDKVVLVRIRDDPLNQTWPVGKGFGPALVSDAMIEGLKDKVSAIVDVPATKPRLPEAGGTMVFNALEEAAAKTVAPPHMHEAVAQALLPVLDRLM